MKNIYETNNLPFFSQKEIRLRRQFESHFENELEKHLRDRNQAWRLEQIEAPCLIPDELINEEYDRQKMFMIEKNDFSLRSEFVEWVMTASLRDKEAFCQKFSHPPLPDMILEDAEFPRQNDQMWRDAWIKDRNIKVQSFALRPETTPASYAWMADKLKEQSLKLPYCVWQSNKSFRREQDQASKHMRLKEFTQQEFQCAFTESTADDYQTYLAPLVKTMIEEMIHCPTRLVSSDRLPLYSKRTWDVEAWNSEKWMEICSISLRTDFPMTYKPRPNKEEKILVLEVAIGLDRCVYCFERQKEAWKTVVDAEHQDQINTVPVTMPQSMKSDAVLEQSSSKVAL